MGRAMKKQGGAGGRQPPRQPCPNLKRTISEENEKNKPMLKKTNTGSEHPGDSRAQSNRKLPTFAKNVLGYIRKASGQDLTKHVRVYPKFA